MSPGSDASRLPAGSGGPPLAALAEVVARALEEDLGRRGDPTGAGFAGWTAAAALVARAPGTIAGLPAVPAVMDAVAGRLGTGPVEVAFLAADGDEVAPAAVLARLRGAVPTLLAGERIALNLVGRLSGIATTTAAHVRAVAGTAALVRDTRKTTPGLRELEKYAVRCGGGSNHRMGLFDALLVKDNHIRAAGGLAAAVKLARDAAPDLPLEVEVETLAEVSEALTLGCDLLLLDNMAPATTAAAVRLAAGRARTEASGGITLANIGEVAATGVDLIAVGALTHAAPALDVALDWMG